MLFGSQIMNELFPAHTGWCIFRDRAKADLVLNFYNDVRYDVPSIDMDKVFFITSWPVVWLSVILTPHLSNVAEFRQLQKPNAQTKYFEILSTHPETHCNTTQKLQIDILNLDATFPITLSENVCMVYLFLVILSFPNRLAMTIRKTGGRITIKIWS